MSNFRQRVIFVLQAIVLEIWQACKILTALLPITALALLSVVLNIGINGFFVILRVPALYYRRLFGMDAPQPLPEILISAAQRPVALVSEAADLVCDWVWGR